MEAVINGKVLALKLGDISLESADAIVNSANSALAGGGAVDRAIRDRGGLAVIEECGRLGGCNTGYATVSSAGHLDASWIIHAVGPVWSGGYDREPSSLASAYESSLGRAREKNVRTIAFPAISTGIFSYPMEAAARIALEKIGEHLSGETCITRAVMVLYTDDALRIHQMVLEELAKAHDWSVNRGLTGS